MKYHMSPNRTLCAVLEEMRKAHATHNYSYLPGLIEEAQTMGNRMEAGLWDQKDFTYAREEHKQLSLDIERLKKEKELLGGKS